VREEDFMMMMMMMMMVVVFVMLQNLATVLNLLLMVKNYRPLVKECRVLADKLTNGQIRFDLHEETFDL